MLRQPIYQTRGYENHNDAGAFIAGAIVALLLIAIILGLLLLLKKKNIAIKPDLLEVIQGRYARGEINKEEYESLKNDLVSPNLKQERKLQSS